MSLRDKIKQTEENIRRFRQAEEHKLLLELQIEEGILVNRLLEREEQIREMLAELQEEEEEEEELEMDGLSEPISQDRIEQRRRIYDGLEHIQDYEVRLLKELREKIAMIKSPEHVEEEQRRQDELKRIQEESRRQDELQRRQEEEQRQVAFYRRRQDELRLQYEESRRKDELRRQNELQRRQEEVRRQDELQRRQEEVRRQDELQRRQEEVRRQDELQRRQEESRPQNWSFEVAKEIDRMYGGKTPQQLREMEKSLKEEREWYKNFGR